MALTGSVKPLVLYLTDKVRELERLDIPRAIWGDDVLDDGIKVDQERLRFAGSAGCVRVNPYLLSEISWQLKLQVVVIIRGIFLIIDVTATSIHSIIGFTT